ncbi:MAG: hypothetical protein ABL895_13965 [Cyclobacteriaceae bacterium]
MNDRMLNDNIYQEGAVIMARAHPDVKLVIRKYNQRIYYCDQVDKPEQKQLVYFERELIAPVLSSQSRQFTRVISKFSLKEIHSL